MSERPSPIGSTRTPRCEPVDIPARPILLLAGSLIALVALASWVSSALLDLWSPAGQTSPSAAYRRVVAPLEPRLQVSPRRDLAELRRKEDAQLHGSGLDPETGVVRMPIEDAMSLIVKRARNGREEKP